MTYRRRLALLIAAVLGAVGLTVATPSAVSAADNKCYGASCNGRNPADYCAADAITVGSTYVNSGVLELRYSEKCAANWGRYTPWRRTLMFYFYKGWYLHPRMTVWNPGGTSYGLAYVGHPYPVYELIGTSWTKMTDGTVEACTGIEVIIDHNPQGWEWGSCV